MTYLTFHLVFLVPPIAGLVLAFGWPSVPADELAPEWALPIVSTVALVYTTPWDNYLVAQDIWWYGPDRVLHTIGYVPIEEYAFFLLQPFLTGLFVYHHLQRWASARRQTSGIAAWIGATTFALLTGIGWVLLLTERTGALYLALILVWAAPLLAVMWLYDGEVLWAHRSTLMTATGIPTLYLWIADAIAIDQRIWTISDDYTIGIEAFGLPLEEALFFLFTNLLVVQGILLLVYGSHDASSPEGVRGR